ncbi:hypothetical protein ACFW04_014580 [Cataglyphis niger]
MDKVILITKLILITKRGELGRAPSAYRPICLLDEAGKLLERVLANRPATYGFRGGRSTINAILRVRSLAESIMQESRLTVSLDIRNAFNTLPWSMVGKAVDTFGLLSYMVESLTVEITSGTGD